MPINPIDAGRYGTPEMKAVFQEESRLQNMLDVEAAVAWAQAELGEIPKADSEVIQRCATTAHVSTDRVREVELEIGHETMAIVKALSEACGSSGSFVHLGVTSSDILDTALALQLREALNIIEDKLSRLEKTFMEKASAYRDTLMIGRTHGQHALPMTLGLKFAVWMREVSRHIARLRQCRDRVLVGKITGAVGSQAGLGANAVEVQRLVMQRLGLRPVEVSTQVVQRDRYAELLCLFGIVASSLDRYAAEIRELQRPEIGEVAEGFAERQVGSSTMPHKRNPVSCERISGMARVMRGNVVVALEDIPLWHERDMTHSPAERFIVPEGCVILDYMLALMIGVMGSLYVDERRMRANVDLTGGRALSESVMLLLAKKGIGRPEAYEVVRRLAESSMNEDRPFNEVLEEDDTVRRYLSAGEIRKALEPEGYLGTIKTQVTTAVEETKRERRARGLKS